MIWATAAFSMSHVLCLSHVTWDISCLMSYISTHVSCLSHVVYLCTISRLMSHDALYSRVQWYGRQLLSACLMSYVCLVSSVMSLDIRHETDMRHLDVETDMRHLMSHERASSSLSGSAHNDARMTFSHLCGTWLIHTWDMTHSYVGHDSLICRTWLIHMWDMTLSYVGHDSLICGTWLIHMWDMTLSYVGHDSFICVHIRDMTHSYSTF